MTFFGNYLLEKSLSKFQKKKYFLKKLLNVEGSKKAKKGSDGIKNQATPMCDAKMTIFLASRAMISL